jgi:hypothetical protein
MELNHSKVLPFLAQIIRIAPNDWRAVICENW